MNTQTIVVFGGDGFCGWPLSLELLRLGYKVVIVDNLSRRHLAERTSSPSLSPIASIESRISTARNLVGAQLSYRLMDVAGEPHKLLDLLSAEKPAAVVHFAEQRSAPYSMLGFSQRNYTVSNNVIGTHNIASALIELDMLETHFVHLGTMGVYGYDDALGKIPEGYLEVTVPATRASQSIIYPPNPGSVYHLTKVLDHYTLQFYAKNWLMRVTDLHQGIVWGSQTPLTELDVRLVNRVDYDGEYGTVLNRFLVQGVCGLPISVYGTGGQTRAFISLEDSVRCLIKVIENPPERNGKVRVFNQVAETKTLLDLAEMCSREFAVPIDFQKNPRKEKAENSLSVDNQGLSSLGFEPQLIGDHFENKIVSVIRKYSDRLIPESMDSKAHW